MNTKNTMFGLLTISLLLSLASVDGPDAAFFSGVRRTDAALCAEYWSFHLDSVCLARETVLSVKGRLCNRLGKSVAVIVGEMEGQFAQELRVWEKGLDRSYGISARRGLDIYRELKPSVLKPGGSTVLEWEVPVFEFRDNRQYGFHFTRFQKRYETDGDPVELEPGEYLVDGALRFTVFGENLAHLEEIGYLTVISDNKLWVEVAKASDGVE